MVSLEKAAAPRTVEWTRMEGPIDREARSDMAYALLSNDLDALWTYFLWNHEGDVWMETTRAEVGWDVTPLELV